MYELTIYEKLESLKSGLLGDMPSFHKPDCIQCHGTGMCKRTQEELDSLSPDIQMALEKYGEFKFVQQGRKLKTCDCVNPNYVAYENTVNDIKVLVKIQNHMNIPPAYKKYCIDNLPPILKTKIIEKKRVIEFIDKLKFQIKEKKYVGFYLHGISGTGKSHTGVAIQNAIATNSLRICHYENVPELMRNIKRKFDKDQIEKKYMSTTALIDYLISVPFLYLDDIGVEKPTEYVLEKIYEIIDGRYVRGRGGLIISSNCHPSMLSQKLGYRIMSRIQSMCFTIGMSQKEDKRI